jgi:FkbM family methyltransferase
MIAALADTPQAAVPATRPPWLPEMPRRTGLMQRLYRRYLCGPSHPSKLRVVRWIERRLFPSEGLPFDVGDGVRLYLHPRHEVEAKLLRRQPFQASLNQFIKQNLGAGDVVAIAGVSFGHQPILASRAVGPTGCVVAIDPAPRALLRAQMNLSLNGAGDNVRLVSAALGDEAAAVPMKVTAEDDVQSASLVKPAGSLPVYVLVESLPSILRRLGLARLDVLILDVIGFELPVLRGLEAPALPRLMSVSVHPWVLERTGKTLQDHTALLAGMGYRCYTLDGSPADSVASLRGCQLVAVRGDRQPCWLDKDPSVPLGVFDS